MKTKLIVIGRWLAILPVFIAVYLIAYFIMYISYRFWSDPDSWAMKYVLPIVGSLVSGIFSMVYAAKIAPTHKHSTAFVLLILVVLLGGAELFVTCSQKEYFKMFAILASVIGSIVGFFITKDENELENY